MKRHHECCRLTITIRLAASPALVVVSLGFGSSQLTHLCSEPAVVRWWLAGG